MNISKKVITALLCLLLSACMGVKFTYNNLDWFLPWYLDDYLVLKKDQEQLFDKHLQTIWQWHRLQELPSYSNLLYEMIDDLDKQAVNLERLHYYSDQTEMYYQRVIDKALTVGTSLIADLDDEQINDMFAGIIEEDEEFKEYVAETDLQQRTKKRRKSVAKSFRKWVGKLSKSQKTLIDKWSKESETTLEYRLEYAKNSRQAYKNILANRKNQQVTKQRISELTKQPELLRSKDYSNTIKRNDRRFRNLIIETINSLSNKQRLRLRKKILNYAEDFKNLSAE